MPTVIPQYEHEPNGNETRQRLSGLEPISSRTLTPTQAVISRSSGVFHFTTDDRTLFDFTSGVLVANLGHSPRRWTRRFLELLGLNETQSSGDYLSAVPLTAYNAITPVEKQASEQLIRFCRSVPGGQKIERVLWAASGSEAVHKAIYNAMHVDPSRPMVIATRHGFHGKKGLSYAVTGHERDPERDARVRFVSFPMNECRDVSLRDATFDPSPYRQELEKIWQETGGKIGTLITEPYLGGGGSYHPPKAYLQLLQQFCREHNIVFILDEVQSNFGRTGSMFAYSTYGLEPDLVVLGKGLGNGVPVAAVVGRADIFATLSYGEMSDTWSANPLSSAAVVATLEEFEARDVLGPMRESSAVIEKGLCDLKSLPFVTHIRGEDHGMVWGVECQDWQGHTAHQWAMAFVEACYRGDGPTGVHLLGPLAGKVIRISPPLTITVDEARTALTLIHASLRRLASV